MRVRSRCNASAVRSAPAPHRHPAPAKARQSPPTFALHSPEGSSRSVPYRGPQGEDTDRPLPGIGGERRLRHTNKTEIEYNSLRSSQYNSKLHGHTADAHPPSSRKYTTTSLTEQPVAVPRRCLQERWPDAAATACTGTHAADTGSWRCRASGGAGRAVTAEAAGRCMRCLRGRQLS